MSLSSPTPSRILAVFVLLTIVVFSVYTDYLGLLRSLDSLESDERQEDNLEVDDHLEVVPISHLGENIQTPANEIDNHTETAEQYTSLVEYGDWIYVKDDWDGAPIILESHKLAFFTIPKVGCTTWKQLFRRMMGYSDWAKEGYVNMIPWNPKMNGLKYLYDFPIEKANEIMTSPEWIRAIFVRDPKERLVSAYLDKGVGNPDYMREKCCGESGDCTREASKSLEGFLHVAISCQNSHWRYVEIVMHGSFSVVYDAFSPDA